MYVGCDSSTALPRTVVPTCVSSRTVRSTHRGSYVYRHPSSLRHKNRRGVRLWSTQWSKLKCLRLRSFTNIHQKVFKNGVIDYLRGFYRVFTMSLNLLILEWGSLPPNVSDGSLHSKLNGIPYPLRPPSGPPPPTRRSHSPDLPWFTPGPLLSLTRSSHPSLSRGGSGSLFLSIM